MLSLLGAGLTALQSLACIGCTITVSAPDPRLLARLQQLSELELCNGGLTITNTSRSNGKAVIPWHPIETITSFLQLSASLPTARMHK